MDLCGFNSVIYVPFPTVQTIPSYSFTYPDGIPCPCFTRSLGFFLVFFSLILINSDLGECSMQSTSSAFIRGAQRTEGLAAGCNPRCQGSARVQALT